jgi:hypothetical protein
VIYYLSYVQSLVGPRGGDLVCGGHGSAKGGGVSGRRGGREVPRRGIWRGRRSEMGEGVQTPQYREDERLMGSWEDFVADMSVNFFRGRFFGCVTKDA